MRNLLCSIAFIVCATNTGSAQINIVQQKFINLIDDAQNEFVINTGDIESDNKEKQMVYYKSKTVFGGSVESIVYNKKDSYKYYACYFTLDAAVEELSLANKVLPEWLATINDLVKSGNYIGRDYTAKNGDSITEIKDKSGNYIIELISNKTMMKLVVYAKSWGTR